MPLSAKTIRAQMSLLRPLLSSSKLETIRKAQNKLGELMEAKFRKEVIIKDHPFENFTGAWIVPNDERRQGVMLYLHGGGFACGDLEYAKGFGAMLAERCGCRVFCVGYRLAPEHPFPAALEDALEAYRYLLGKGYPGEHITLCGESAGGGLCYSLCGLLKELVLPMPAGIIGISPWVDLTVSGPSYKENRERDPSMTPELLDFFASIYAENREDPKASPLYAQLSDMPPSLLFVGENEVMRSDAELLHSKLLSAGCKSKLRVKPDRWHAYILYGLEEDAGDLESINAFLSQYMARERKLRWMRLDNAAKIYPAARRQHWSNVFRLSVTLTEPVDKAVLQSALDVTARRFPSMATRLRRGAFWYYLQQLSKAPAIQEESSYPLTRMGRKEVRQCAFRVIVYNRRIALEVFHSLTDGSGAMIFLKTLLAEYLQQKYGVSVPARQGVLGRLEEPSEEELEDSFLKYAGKVSTGWQGTDAWHLTGTPEPDGALNLTCFQIPVDQALAVAKSYKVTLTTFLGAAIMQALQQMQQEQVPNIRRRKAIKLQIPVNLRRIFPSRSLRNFALYTTPEIDPRLGEYSFEEICRVIQHRMGLDVQPKAMSAMIATNVQSEKLMAVKIMPLFVKNIVMKAVFSAVGERKSCLSMSNLGAVEMPEEMRPFVERMDFILGVQATAPYNCGILSVGNTLYINFIRNTREPALEAHFHRVLRDMGLPVTVQTNR